MYEYIIGQIISVDNLIWTILNITNSNAGNKI